MSSSPLNKCVLAVVDEAGEHGLLRRLTPRRDEKFGLLCALLLPAEHIDAIRADIRPLYDDFVRAAPANAKLHITDAFLPHYREWGLVATRVRRELFDYMLERGLYLTYAARRCAVARATHGLSEGFIQRAMENHPANLRRHRRVPAGRFEDLLMAHFALRLDSFAHDYKRETVLLAFDEIDQKITAGYLDVIEQARNFGKPMPGGGDAARSPPKYQLTFSVEGTGADMLSASRLGGLQVYGKCDPLVFAADVVANSLHRHLAMLAADAPLNVASSVARWVLEPVTWGVIEHSVADYI